MANEAHKEPTMEEILASIRKIIADDTPAAAAPARPALREAPYEPASPQFDNDDSDLGMFDADDVEFQPEPPADIDLDLKEEIVGPEFTFEAMLGASQNRETPSASPDLPEETDLEEEEPEFSPAPAPVIRAATPKPSVVEPAMSAAPRFNAPLIEDQVAESAAGALGKLISKMDISSDNTLEGLVRELVRPMIKEWLDDNLSRIVEEKVEAEVQRIGRMAR